MTKYLALYTGTRAGLDAWNAQPEDVKAQRGKEGMAAWRAWAEKHAAAIVDPGSPVGKATRVTASGIAPAVNPTAAYVVVQADSAEAAAQIFVGHPHFTIFPGDGVDLMELTPIPSR